MTISAKDAEILRLLQAGSVTSRQQIAEAVGMSPTTVWRRISELEASGYIKEQVTLLNPEKVGVPVCVFVFVNLKDYHIDTRKTFERFVDEAPEIMECYSLTGANDYVLMLRCRSVSDFERFLMEEILAHKGVEAASSQISLRQHKYTTALSLRSKRCRRLGRRMN